MPMTRYQRPWHFLYFAPDPHQHGSLRPIRSPLGVNPGRGPLAAEPAPLPITGSSPSDSRIGRVEGPEGPPRRIAEPPAPVEVAALAPTRSAVAGVAPAAAGARAPARGGPGGAGGPRAAAGARARWDPCPPASAAAPGGGGAATAGSPPAGTAGSRVTVTRKIDEATPWRMRPRSSSYSWKA